MSLEISVLSTEYVKVEIDANINGSPADPTTDTVQMAFVQTGGIPGPADWKTGSWETSTVDGLHYARCLVGPAGAVQLVQGEQYGVWVKITDDPESPVLLSGTIEVI